MSVQELEEDARSTLECGGSTPPSIQVRKHGHFSRTPQLSSRIPDHAVGRAAGRMLPVAEVARLRV